MFGVEDHPPRHAQGGQVAIFATVDQCTAECLSLPRGQARRPAPGFGQNQPSRARALRRPRKSHPLRGEAAPGSRLPVQGRRPSKLNPVPGHQALPRRCPSTASHWLRRGFFDTLKAQLQWVRDFFTSEELTERLRQLRHLCKWHWVAGRHILRFARRAGRRLLASEALASHLSWETVQRIGLNLRQAGAALTD